MVPSRITTQRVSLWSLMSLFAVVLFLLPTAFTVAQDFDAVIERLKQAVDAKEISPEQAKKMIATLKISSSKQAPIAKSPVKKDASHAKVNWDAIKKQVEGAVKAGKITREQADAKYTALKKQAPQKPAVKKVEGKPKPAAPAKPAVKKDASHAKVNWEVIKKKIEGAVKAGTITREQADAKYEALKKQSAQKPPIKKDAGKPKALPAKPAAKKKPQ